MTDPGLIAKKLAFIETCVAELERLADAEALGRDLLQERFVEHTLQLAIQGALDVASHIVSDNRLGDLVAYVERIRSGLDLTAGGRSQP